MKQFLITLLAGLLAALIVAAVAGCTFPDRGMPSRRCVELRNSMLAADDPPPMKCDPEAEKARAERLWQAHQSPTAAQPQVVPEHR